MSKASFDEQLAYGTEGEGLVARKLIDRGATVIPLFQYEKHDRVPVAFAKKGSRVLPDLDVFIGERRVFVEVKRKQKWARGYREPGSVETGCNSHLYDQYVAWSREHGVPVYLIFVHEKEDPTGYFLGEALELEPHKRVWNGRATNGDRLESAIAFFPFEALKRWGGK